MGGRSWAVGLWVVGRGSWVARIAAKYGFLAPGGSLFPISTTPYPHPVPMHPDATWSSATSSGPQSSKHDLTDLRTPTRSPAAHPHTHRYTTLQELRRGHSRPLVHTFEISAYSQKRGEGESRPTPPRRGRVTRAPAPISLQVHGLVLRWLSPLRPEGRPVGKDELVDVGLVRVRVRVRVSSQG